MDIFIYKGRKILLSLLTSGNKLSISNAKVGWTRDPNKNCEMVKTDPSVFKQNEKYISRELFSSSHRGRCTIYVLKEKSK